MNIVPQKPRPDLRPPQHPLRTRIRLDLHRREYRPGQIRRAERVYWALKYLAPLRSRPGGDRLAGAVVGSLRGLGRAFTYGLRRRGLTVGTLKRAMPDLRAIGAILCLEIREQTAEGWRTLATIYLVARTPQEMDAFRHIHFLACEASPRASVAAVASTKAVLKAFRAGAKAFCEWASGVRKPRWARKSPVERLTSAELEARAEALYDDPETRARWVHDKMIQQRSPGLRTTLSLLRRRPWAGFAARCPSLATC